MEPERNGDILIRASYATDYPQAGQHPDQVGRTWAPDQGRRADHGRMFEDSCGMCAPQDTQRKGLQ